MRLENPRGFLRILKDFWGLLELFKDSYGQSKRSPRILEDSLRNFLKLVQDIQILMAVLRHWGIFEVIHSSGIWRSPWRFQRSFLFFFFYSFFLQSLKHWIRTICNYLGFFESSFFFPQHSWPLTLNRSPRLHKEPTKRKKGEKKM